MSIWRERHGEQRYKLLWIDTDGVILVRLDKEVSWAGDMASFRQHFVPQQ